MEFPQEVQSTDLKEYLLAMQMLTVPFVENSAENMRHIKR